MRMRTVPLTGDDQHDQFLQIVDGRSVDIDIGGSTTDFLSDNRSGDLNFDGYADSPSKPDSQGCCHKLIRKWWTQISV